MYVYACVHVGCPITIASVQAISKQLKICVDDLVLTRFQAKYPTANLVPAYNIDGGVSKAALMRNGYCQAALMYKDEITLLHAGASSTADCSLVKAGAATQEKAYCVRSADGAPDLQRDCNLVQVGGLIGVVAIALPVHGQELSAALSWGILHARSIGTLETLVRECISPAAWKML